MQPQDKPADVVVIGGGMAGLTAACYLARSGLAVTLFEKAARLGGRAATQIEAGFSFNRGIHALYTGGAASEILCELGVTYRAGSPKATYVLQNGQIFPFPAGPSALVRSKLLSVRDKLELMRLFATLGRLDPRSLARVSVQDWLEQALGRPQVRRLLAAVARTFVYSAALDLVSADVFIAKLQRSLKHPVHYLDGGWQTLVDSLRQIAEQAGARIISGARVEAVERHNGQVSGVRLGDGSLIKAAAVIIATNPRDAARLLDTFAAPTLNAIIDKLIPARLACLDVALHRLPASPHTIVQDLQHPRFLSTQSLYARIAPEHGALVCSFKQLDPRQPTDPRADQRELEDLLDIALPGWRELLVKRMYLPSIEAVGALPLASAGGMAGRPDSRVATNLYVVGDWVGGEGFLVDASMASARQVARQLILERVHASTASLEGTL
ncbi:MAG: NAD(P)/FAD-dependent oxidoreductase [Roseiflexaceae bacterium]